MSTYYTKFTVSGATQFPLDMLRYDSCYPFTGDDVAKLNHRGRRDITLVHVCSNPKWRPTAGRWSSFMWSVDEASVDTR